MTQTDEQFNSLKPQNISVPLFQLIMALLKTRYEIISNVAYTLISFRKTRIFKRKISVHLIVTSPSNPSGAVVFFFKRFLKYAKLHGPKPFLRKQLFLG